MKFKLVIEGPYKEEDVQVICEDMEKYAREASESVKKLVAANSDENLEGAILSLDQLHSSLEIAKGLIRGFDITAWDYSDSAD